eukprot:scaffold16187_cov30-Phaeocystis_antarctica.AAC.1
MEVQSTSEGVIGPVHNRHPQSSRIFLEIMQHTASFKEAFPGRHKEFQTLGVGYGPSAKCSTSRCLKVFLIANPSIFIDVSASVKDKTVWEALRAAQQGAEAIRLAAEADRYKRLRAKVAYGVKMTRRDQQPSTECCDGCRNTWRVDEFGSVTAGRHYKDKDAVDDALTFCACHRMDPGDAVDGRGAFSEPLRGHMSRLLGRESASQVLCTGCIQAASVENGLRAQREAALIPKDEVPPLSEPMKDVITELCRRLTLPNSLDSQQRDASCLNHGKTTAEYETDLECLAHELAQSQEREEALAAKLDTSEGKLREVFAMAQMYRECTSANGPWHQYTNAGQISSSLLAPVALRPQDGAGRGELGSGGAQRSGFSRDGVTPSRPPPAPTQPWGSLPMPPPPEEGSPPPSLPPSSPSSPVPEEGNPPPPQPPRRRSQSGRHLDARISRSLTQKEKRSSGRRNYGRASRGTSRQLSVKK